MERRISAHAQSYWSKTRFLGSRIAMRLRIASLSIFVLVGLGAILLPAIAFRRSALLPQNCEYELPICMVRQDVVRWHFLDVSDSFGQADAHLIQFGNGSTVLLDAGETTNRLAPRILQRGIKRIDRELISHPHKDHYNAFLSLL